MWICDDCNPFLLLLDLIEEFIEGRELNVAIFQDEGTRALPISEIDFTEMPDSEEKLAHLRKLFVILSDKISARADILNGFCDFMKNGGADRGA